MRQGLWGGDAPAADVKDKATQNLEASRLLVKNGLLDPAMSRLYYALFQAGVHALEKQGKKPDDFTRDATQWKHGWLGSNAFLCRGRKADKSMFRMACSLRERADYREQRVLRDEVDALLPDITAFVQEVCA